MPEPAFAALDPAVAIRRRDPVGMVSLQADLARPEVAAAVTAATGCPLPGVRRFVAAGDAGVAWMSQTELVIIVTPVIVSSTVARLAEALAGIHHLAVDVSDARAVFRLEGPGAREVLAKGAPVDLDPAAFGPGDFRRTRLGQVAAALWMPAAEAFELVCFRSVAPFVAAWLEQAARPGSLPGHLRRRCV